MKTDNHVAPKCAVLLAAYNGMRYLDEQLNSILDQIGVDLTVFISVDVSTDGSEDWLSTLAKKDSRIVILPNGRKFGIAAKNFYRLILEADFSAFDYVALSDQDDYWFPDKLSRACTKLKNDNFDGYSSNVVAFWSDGKRKLINKAQAERKWDYVFEGGGPGCTFIMNIKLVHEIKKCLLDKWDNAQNIEMHDWFCYAFARANGFKWFIDPEPSMLYRQHGNNQLGANTGFKAYIYRLKQIRSGDWLKQASLIADTIGFDNETFISGWSRLGRKELIQLAFKASQCRRDFLERTFFCLLCFYLAVVGGVKNNNIS